MKELCENQCYDLYQRPIATDPACSSACQRRTPMCLCNPGLYRLDGRCVPKEECPSMIFLAVVLPETCNNALLGDCKDPREIRVSCDQPIDPRCQPSCSDPQRDRNSPLVPGVSIFYCTWGFCEMLSCACRDGFVRDDVSLKCVPKEECSS